MSRLWLVLPLLLFGCQTPTRYGRSLRADLAVSSRPCVAPHGFLRYDGTMRFVDAGLSKKAVPVPGTLESALRRFQNDEEGRELWIVGTIHTGSAAYYRALQERLDRCGLVIYEDLRGVRSELASLAQVEEARRDGLVSQGGALRPRESWRRGDLDWPAVKAYLKALGIDPGALERTPAAPDVASEAPLPLKLHDAAQEMVCAADQLLSPIRDPRGLWSLSAADWLDKRPFHLELEDYALIYRRNDEALRVLRASLAAAPKGRPVALLYGASHGADLAERVEALGFVEVAVEWFPAWPVRELELAREGS